MSRYIKDFTIIKPDVDEDILVINPKDLPLEESKQKAYAIFSKYPNDTVLACDTVVILNGEVLGKPHNKETAFKMLKNESGKKQIVLSGYTFINKNIEVNRTVASIVYFNELSDDLINQYIEEKKPFDKAGAYGIQDEFNLIHHIEGSYDNVMGLPIEDILAHCPIK